MAAKAGIPYQRFIRQALERYPSDEYRRVSTAGLSIMPPQLIC